MARTVNLDEQSKTAKAGDVILIGGFLRITVSAVFGAKAILKIAAPVGVSVTHVDRGHVPADNSE